MSRVSTLFIVVALAATLAGTVFAAASSEEVLYIAERQHGTILLLTYDVNPETAVARQAGTPIFVGASNIDPLTIGAKHFVYVWDGTDVWLYPTASNGAPDAQPAQHLTFNFAYPVYSFVADPDGKYAYAAILWTDSQGNSDAAITLFTIDPSTGKLSDTQKVVATYSNYYTYLNGFSFGIKGNMLFAQFYDDGPYTCEPGYDGYPVNQANGNLGAMKQLIAGNANCGSSSAVTITDQLGGAEHACCGAGSGYVEITRIASGTQIFCQASNLTFCGDDAGDITFDPASENIIFPDTDVKETFIGHIDFAQLQLAESPSTIPGTPAIYFSPDSQVLFGLYKQKIGIYAFQSSTGEILASSSLSLTGKATVATATLHQ
jgi:hypothetical protein